MRPDGRMAGYVIHAPAGLSAVGERRLAELVPMDVLADGSPEELAELRANPKIGAFARA